MTQLDAVDDFMFAVAARQDQFQLNQFRRRELDFMIGQFLVEKRSARPDVLRLRRLASSTWDIVSDAEEDRVAAQVMRLLV